jgi:HEPN domain-containing protein
MKVSELKELLEKLIKENKGDYIITSYNGDWNYGSYGEKVEIDTAEITIDDKRKYVDISVGG